MPQRGGHRPNILLFLADHQAFYGHHRPAGPAPYEYLWPTFERLAGDGARFDRTYTISPLCTPARASIMTGLPPSRHGLLWNTDYGTPHDLRPGQELFCHHLARAGYRNAYVGKWHVGKEKLPEHYGMEGWSLPDYGQPYMSEAYARYTAERGLGPARARIERNTTHPDWAGTTQVLHHPSPWHFMNGCGVLEGPPEAHETSFIAHLAVERLEVLARGGGPWSLVVSFWSPHQPYYPSEPFASRVDPAAIPAYPTFDDDLAGRPFRYVLHRDFAHKSRRAWPEWSDWQLILARAYAQGLQTDAAVASVLGALARLGLADDTLVVWTADHGDALASHGGCWDKASTYIEEVARVPLAISWPGRVAAGSRVDRPVTNMDLAATILDAAGVAVPPDWASRSLLPLAREPRGAPWPDGVIAEHHGHPDRITQRILVTARHKYVAALFDGDELYDLANDPFETRNLAGDPSHQDLARELRRRIAEHIESTNDQPARKLAHRLRHDDRLG